MGMDLFDRHVGERSRRNGRRSWDAADVALLALIRLALEDSWSAQRAAAELRLRVTDESVLYRVRARVRNALSDRPTPVAQRCARTLEVLLGEPARLSSGVDSGHAVTRYRLARRIGTPDPSRN